MSKRKGINFTNKNPDGPKNSGQRCNVLFLGSRLYRNISIETGRRIVAQSPEFKLEKIA